jgi:hypothetical protein
MNDFQNIFTFGFNAFSQWGGIGFIVMLIALVAATVHLRREAKASYEKDIIAWDSRSKKRIKSDSEWGTPPSRPEVKGWGEVALMWVVFLGGYWLGFM